MYIAIRKLNYQWDKMVRPMVCEGPFVSPISVSFVWTDQIMEMQLFLMVRKSPAQHTVNDVQSLRNNYCPSKPDAPLGTIRSDYDDKPIWHCQTL